MRLAEDVFKHPNLLQKVIIPRIANKLGSAYPELEKNFEKILKIADFETESYNDSLLKSKNAMEQCSKYGFKSIDATDALEYLELPRAVKYLEKILIRSSKRDPESKSVSAGTLLDLHSKFGLDEEILRKLMTEFNLTAPLDSLEKLIEERKLLAKLQLAPNEENYLSDIALRNLPHTDDSFKYLALFDHEKGVYELPELKASILWMNEAKDGMYRIILDKTNFYARAGGQDCDNGTIESENGLFLVEKVQQANNYVVHVGRFAGEDAKFKVGDEVSLKIEAKRRTALTQNHTGEENLNNNNQLNTYIRIFQTHLQALIYFKLP